MFNSDYFAAPRPAILVAVGVVTGANAGQAPARIAGDHLVDPSGRSLYAFGKDVPNFSRCDGPCAITWPPYIATSPGQANHDFKVMRRSDGTAQWSFRGHPLYYFVGDKAAGAANGLGKPGWALVPPDVDRIPPHN